MNAAGSQRKQNKLILRVIVLLLIVAAAWLRPRFEEWTEGGANDQSDAAQQKETSDSNNRTNPSSTDGDLSDDGKLADLLVAEQLTTTYPAETRSEHPPKSSIPAEARPGKLTLVGKNVFRSTEGLMYLPGSRDGHRLKHILKHAKDDPSKPVHGVFDGDRDQILEWIDVAWKKAQKGGQGVTKRNEGGRAAWTVKMDDPIGYVGGQTGKRKGYPNCRFLRLVLEEKNTVVTAYPTSSD